MGVALVLGLSLRRVCWPDARSFLNPASRLRPDRQQRGHGCYRQIDSTLVPGWSTTHLQRWAAATAPRQGIDGRLIELWRTTSRVWSRAMPQFRRAQCECVVAHIPEHMPDQRRIDPVALQSPRPGSATVRDVMDFNVGASQAVVRVGTTSNGAFNVPIVSQGSANSPASGGNGWVDYTGSSTIPRDRHHSLVSNRSVPWRQHNRRNFLDNIQIELRPFVEFVQASSSTPESASNNIPTLRVNGTVFTAFNVTVQITGGTATLGTDYTTPGNSTSLTIAIPAGIYDGVGSGSLFPLPVTVTHDALGEGNETIVFAITPPSGASPPSCSHRARPVVVRHRPRGPTPSSTMIRASR